ncbi:MAG: MATE family efflux transporter [Chloroflexi bacterium]|nr:MATE family efflux transporter [Chloroflexota bacterium]
MTFNHLIARLNTLRQPPDRNAPIALNRQLLRLAGPSLVENLLQTMLMVCDMIFVGQLGKDAIAGIGLGMQLTFFLQVAFMGLAVGNTALIARAIGAGDQRAAERIAKQSLTLAVVISIVIGALTWFAADDIVRVMGATASVNALASDFLRIVSGFAFVMGVMFIGSGTLRGAGDTVTPMLITGFINLINIVVAYTLIFGNFGFPRVGPLGAAVAMTVSRAVGAALILYVLFRRTKILPLALRGGWGFHRDVIARILNIGLPGAAEQIVFQAGFLVFAAMAVSLGTANYAAQQVAFTINGFSIMPAFAFGVAATTLVGQNLGAKNPERAEQSAYHALKNGTLWMVVMGIAFIIWREPLVRVFTCDPDVWQPAEMCLTFIALSQPFLSVSMIVASALRGAGDTRATLAVTFAGIWLMRVGGGYILGIVLGLGLFGMWIAWSGDFMVRALLVALRFRTGKWKTLRV